jgi:glyoxylase-like metal-dependent hydrolase (beta-lactamase superfamily II)
VQLREIATDVYACLQEDRGVGWSNSGFVARGGGLVVDTFWDLPHTRELIENYARVWKQPAGSVVNTHHNGDHCWGNQLFPQAEIIGHRLCAASFGKESPALLQQLRDASDSEDPVLAHLAGRLQSWDFRGIEPTPPSTLVEDRLDLDLDGLAVEIVHVGPAHTAGDVIVHVPQRRVVFTGDVLFRLCTPLGWEGTFARWIEALEHIAALEPQTLVPGHGPPCGVEGALEMKAYLEYIRREAGRFFAQELSPLEAAKRVDLGPYGDWTEPERVYGLVERAYRELRGEAHDAPIDALALFRGIQAVRLHREQRASRTE